MTVWRRIMAALRRWLAGLTARFGTRNDVTAPMPEWVNCEIQALQITEFKPKREVSKWQK